MTADEMDDKGPWSDDARLKARYEFVTAQLRYTNDKILDAFKDWSKLFAAIVGGYLWLKIEKPNLPDGLADLRIVAKCLLGFVCVCYALMIGFGARSWFDYRKAEKVTMPEAVAPKFPRSVAQELLMIFIIALITLVACYSLP